MSCATALAPKKIKSAVRKVADDTGRGKNSVIYSVAENVSENTNDKVSQILQEIDGKLPIITSSRVGVKQPEKCRPEKVTLKIWM